MAESPWGTGMMAEFPAWVLVLIGAEFLLVACAVSAWVWCGREIRKLEGQVELARAVGTSSLLESDRAPETEEERDRRIDEIARRIEGSRP